MKSIQKVVYDGPLCILCDTILSKYGIRQPDGVAYTLKTLPGMAGLNVVKYMSLEFAYYGIYYALMECVANYTSFIVQLVGMNFTITCSFDTQTMDDNGYNLGPTLVNTHRLWRMLVSMENCSLTELQVCIYGFLLPSPKWYILNSKEETDSDKQ